MHSLPSLSNTARLRRSLRFGVAGVLAVALLIGVGQASFGQKEKHKSPPKNTKNSTKATRGVLMFPPDTKGGMSDQLSDVVIDVTRARLTSSGDYTTRLFARSIPSVLRALNEQSLAATDVQHPFDNDAKVKRLAALTGYSLVLVTSIDDYSYDADKQQVSLVMSARLIDLAGDKPVLRSAGESGSSAEKAAKDDKDIKPGLAVARDLAEKLMTTLLKPAKAGSTDK